MVPIINPANGEKMIFSGAGYKDQYGKFIPVHDGVVRVVLEKNYSDSFGYQWKKFNKTQLDRALQNCQLSKERFFAQTGWNKEDLAGKDVLEVGSGAGRFTQVVLDYTNANLYSIDYSDAVFVNSRNNSHHGTRLKLFQASIYEMPFPDNSFDKVFCFGVLQHTPDFKQAIKCLVDKVKPGGELAVDFYPIKGWWTKIHAKYILRPLTKKMAHDKLLNLIDKHADLLIRLYHFFDRIGVEKFVNRFLPVSDIKGSIPPNLSREELREWVVLDTFDMFSPEHDHPQKLSTVVNWFKEFGMEVTFAGIVKVGDYYKVTTVKGIKK